MDLIRRQWFFFALAAVFILVLADPTRILVESGRVFKDNHGPDILIFLIFILSGCIIDVEQIRAGLRDFSSTLTALLLIVVVSPIAAVLLGLSGSQTGIILGLYIVSVMPTTLSSGVVMTDKAGGNMAHALFITILSNIVAIVSIPVVLSFLLRFLDQERSLVIDQGAIILKLIIIVLLPLTAGMILKHRVFDMTQTQRQLFQNLNQWMVVFIIFMSLASVRDILLSRLDSILVILPLTLVFHTILLAAAFGFCKLFRIDKGRRESVIFMGSQKTLPLSIVIQMNYFPEFGTALLVCVLHHVVHLMMDGYLCEKLK